MSEIKPIAYDMFCGLGGWTEGLLAAGYDVTGFDIEAHEYESKCLHCDGTGNFYRADEDGDWLNCDCYVDAWNYGKVTYKYPARLVLRDVLTIHGSELADASIIVASPPCQTYSYMAMPWSRAKAIAAEYRSGVRSIDDLNALFNACFRIQREASEAAGRYIPMVVENVKGAQPWVGKAKANFGSFYLWGDVEMVGDRVIVGGMRWGGVRAEKGGRKGNGSWFGNYEEAKAAGKGAPNRYTSSKSLARKAASAQIAKIPYALSHYIANAYKPK